MEKKHLMRVETLRAELKRRLGETLESGDAGKIAALANLVKLMGIALAPDDEVDPATLTLTVQQVAQALEFHPEHVRRLLRSGALAGERVGRDYQVALPALIAWQDHQRAWGQTAQQTNRLVPFEKVQAEMFARVALDKETLAWDFFTGFVQPPRWLSSRERKPPSFSEDVAQGDEGQEI